MAEKDPHELAQIQSEFVSRQAQVLGDKTKEFGQTIMQGAGEVTKTAPWRTRKRPRTARNSFRARPRRRPGGAAHRPKAARYRSGMRKIAARGGTTRLSSEIPPLSNVLTVPPFPILLPP
jgi:hypothetical protein